MLLEFRNVKKYFPLKEGILGRGKSFVKAVDGVNLTIRAMENMGVVGESGCGKTTLARIALKLIAPDEGSVFFEGKDVTSLKEGRFRPLRRHIQMVFQDPYSSLDPRFTIRDVLKEAMTLDHKRHASKQAAEKYLCELMISVNLPENILDRYPHEFSGGERQRVAIARALVLKPKLLILDEAVSNLDVLIQEQILNLLLELQNKFQLTYLFISHNLKVVCKVSRTIAVMYKGKIVELGPKEAILGNPLHPYTKELFLAAFQYRVSEKDSEINLPEKSHLVEQEPGHWVLA